MTRPLLSVSVLVVASLSFVLVFRPGSLRNAEEEPTSKRTEASEVINPADDGSAPLNRPTPQEENQVLAIGAAENTADHSEIAIHPAPTPDALLAEALRNDARRFEKQLESYYLGSDDYDEWSHEATTYLSARFESEEHDIWVDCGKDICLMDVTAPYRAILTEFRPKVAEWEASQPPGFLVSSFFFNNNNGSYRFYFFRDTFDPNALR